MGIGKDQCVNVKNAYGCIPCDYNKMANIEAKWESIGIRTDIESELLELNRPNSRCVSLKHKKCSDQCSNNKCTNKCHNYVIMNTRICDRNIVPTNNSMPTTTGF